MTKVQKKLSLKMRSEHYKVELAYIGTSGGLQKSADIRELPL